MDPDVDDLTSLLRELIARESENPPGNEAACARFVKSWLAERGVDATLVAEPHPDRPQVAASVGEGTPTVVLNAHLDVVPASDPDQWTADPYEGVVADEKVYGRGAADTKAGLALAMTVASELREELVDGDLGGSLVLHAPIGEETGDPGTKTLLEKGYTGDYGVVLEPTGFRVATSTKGVGTYRLTVRGESSHASRPDQGRNPIEGAHRLLKSIEEYDENLRTKREPVLGPAYATVTEFVSGADSNLAVIPNEASLLLDRRLLPEEEIEAVDREIDDIVNGASDDHFEVTWKRVQYYRSASVPADSPIAEVFRETAAERAGIDRNPWGLEAATDMRNFVHDADIPAITWGPGHLSQAHTVDEYVPQPHLRTGYTILAEALRTVLD